MIVENQLKMLVIFFFSCRIHQQARIELFTPTRDSHPFNIYQLLIVEDSLTIDQNILLFEAVHQYIKNTKRFENRYWISISSEQTF